MDLPGKSQARSVLLDSVLRVFQKCLINLCQIDGFEFSGQASLAASIRLYRVIAEPIAYLKQLSLSIGQVASP